MTDAPKDGIDGCLSCQVEYLRSRPVRRRRVLCALFGILLAVLVLPFSYAVAYHWVISPSEGDLPFHDSIAAGDLSAWSGIGMQQLCCDFSARVLDAPGQVGGRALKFVLNHDDADVRGSRRSELRLRAVQFGNTYEYKVRVFVPPAWVGDPTPVTVVQWHNVPQLLLGEPSLPSVLRLDVEGDAWLIKLAWGRPPRWLDRGGDLHAATLWRGKLERNSWIEWTFRVKWSGGDDGAVMVWKGDELIVNHVGPSAYASELAPYFKIGLYVPGWEVFPDRPTATRNREIWFSDITVRQITGRRPASHGRARPGVNGGREVSRRKTRTRHARRMPRRIANGTSADGERDTCSGGRRTRRVKKV